MRAGQWAEALALAARLPHLGKHRGAILSAHGAVTTPRFYVEIGRDCDRLIEEGKAALRDRFGEKP